MSKINSQNSSKKGIVRRAGGQLIKPYTHAFHTSARLVRSINSGSREVIEAAKNVKNVPLSTDPDIVAARKIENDKERFEFLYRQKNWSQKELMHQRKILQRSQLISMFFALVGAASVIWSASLVNTNSSLLFAFALFFLSMIGMSIFVGNTVKIAIHVAQIDDRSLLSSREFMNRDDVWKRLLLPFSRPKKLSAG